DQMAESLQAPALRIERDDYCVGPEPKPVLANPPVAVLEASLHLRELEVALGIAVPYRLGRVEARHVVTDDLVGVGAEDALGAGVPARDAPGRIQPADGAVVHALDEQSKALLACAQRLFGLLAPHE